MIPDSPRLASTPSDLTQVSLGGNGAVVIKSEPPIHDAIIYKYALPPVKEMRKYLEGSRPKIVRAEEPAEISPA